MKLCDRRRRVGALSALSLLVSAFARGQREPVLRQIDVPHNYYYREMYLPQVTSGPNAAAWSPDGKELVYAMQGTLWRQKPESKEAVQLTDGPGYDSEPDWSPDGRCILYTSYRNDALELRVLDLENGLDAALVSNGAANLDGRWSPDGRQVAYVSTAEHRRWHVFLVSVADGRAAGAPVRITEEVDSGLPRIYYSRFDHYLSPSWSPEGRELILVSNKGAVSGSGGIWRMEARRGAPMRPIRIEETNWKARPDWARDGRRVVYSSYLGRQRNQLWLTMADGGEPFELTYCDCDHTRPRWSPDGRRIAFVSNEGGNVSLYPRDSGGIGRNRRGGDAALPPSDGNAASHGDERLRSDDAGAALGHRRRRPRLGARYRLAPRR
jgi:TolB protein